MIFISNHAQAKPKVLVKKALAWTIDYYKKCNAYLANPSNTNKIAKEAAEKKYQHKDIKNALISVFHHKCAYCESNIGAVDFGDIEHFAPKSIYPELCFEWDNLLLACSKCNNKPHKGVQFPLDAQGQPLLINPAREAPNEFLRFIYNPQSKIAEVEAINNNPKGVETIKIFGLNSPNRRELLKKRTTVVFQLVYIAINAAQGDSDAQSLMQKAVQATEEYAAFARQLWVQLNLSPLLQTIV